MNEPVLILTIHGLWGWASLLIWLAFFAFVIWTAYAWGRDNERDRTFNREVDELLANNDDE